MRRRQPRPLPTRTEAQVHDEERAALGLEAGDPLAALCLSGGGIRSAAFCLGAVQALAQTRLLAQFHYLSTVSGGGYIGAWLTRCITTAAEQPDKGAAAPATAVRTPSQVLDDILGVPRLPGASRKADESPELRTLRQYTSFLNPHPGLASSDTTAGVVLWLRNTLINWMVFLPLLLALAGIPLFYLSLVGALAQRGSVADGLAVAAGLLGIALLIVAVHRSCVDLPSHMLPDTAEGVAAENRPRLGDRAISSRIVVWTLAWAVLAPLAAAPLLRLPDPLGCPRAIFVAGTSRCPPVLSPDGQVVVPAAPAIPAVAPIGLPGTMVRLPATTILPLLFVVACLVGFCTGAVHVFRDYRRGMIDPRSRRLQRVYRRQHMRAFYCNAPFWIAGCAASAGLLLLGEWLVCGESGLWLALLGPPWVVGAETLRTTVYVALRRAALRSDLDREWLARLNAAKLRPVIAYAALALASLLLPRLVFDTHTAWRWVVGVAGFASGPVGALLGKSGLTTGLSANGKAPRLPLDAVVGIAAAVFGLAMLMLAGRVVTHVVLGVPGWWLDLPGWAGAAPAGPLWTMAAAALALVASLFVLGIYLGYAINLNRFSMHGVYRNRLIRAFLGSARGGRRRPDAFTGFDPQDDVRLTDCFDPKRPKPRQLFPVVNVALNRTTVSDTAQAERKAASFTMTPLHCGSASLRAPAGPMRPADAKADALRVPEGVYVDTKAYAGADKETGPRDKHKGLRLGTAITISGAAASPDMGYHSSPGAAFLMTLFNVRLGAWLPNPGAPSPTDALMQRSTPRSGAGRLLDELMGRSGDAGDFVYLSDGGHFDNLGLYEMLRRRCQHIVVIDAGRDPDYGYFDLGRALQHALVDRGVTVEFVQPLTMGKGATLQPHGAYARITYADPPGQGEILYLKPWLPPGAPTPVQAFKAVNEDFPHASTLNQFFNESAFESYRALGEWITRTALDSATARLRPGRAGHLDDIFAELRNCALGAKPPGPAAVPP